MANYYLDDEDKKKFQELWTDHSTVGYGDPLADDAGDSGFRLYPVKVTATDSGGGFLATEQVWDKDTSSWIEQDNPIEWDSTEDIGAIFEYNGRHFSDFPFYSFAFSQAAQSSSVDDGSEWFFFRLTEDNNMPFAGNESGGNIVINGGSVFYEKDDGLGAGADPVVVTSNSFAMTTDWYVYCKIEATIDNDPDVTATIVASATAEKDEDYDESGLKVTKHWMLGQVISGAWTPGWENDIHIQYPNTPDFSGFGQRVSAEKRDLDLSMFYNANSALEAAFDSNTMDALFESNIGTVQVQSGVVRDFTNNEVEATVGGLTATIDRLMGADFSTANTISLTTQGRRSIAGLTLSDNVASSVLNDIKCKVPIFCDTGGNLHHGVTPNTADYQYRGIYVYDTDQTTKIAATIGVNGHILAIDGTDLPSVSNTVYNHCDDFYPPLIFDGDQGTVIQVDGECYESGGTTGVIPTSPAPTVTGTMSSCDNCKMGGDNFEYLKCDGDAAAFISATNVGNYIWWDNGSEFVGAYFNDNVTTALTSPVPCTANNASTEVPLADRFTPINCNQVDLSAFGDNFSGSSINSCKFPDGGHSGFSQGTGELAFSLSDGNVGVVENSSTAPTTSGPFTASVILEVTTNHFNSQIQLGVRLGSNWCDIGVFNDEYFVRYRNPTGSFELKGAIGSLPATATLKIARAAGTVTWYIDDVSKKTVSDSGDMDAWSMLADGGSGAGENCSGAFEDLSFTGTAPYCIPATDEFDDIAPSSGSITDEFWTKRWTASGSGTQSFGSTSLFMEATGGNDVFLLNAADVPTPVAGDVVIIMDVAGISMTPPTPVTKSPAGNIVLAFTNGDAVLIQYQWKPAPTSQKQFNILTYYSAVVNTVYAEDATSTGSNNWFGELKIVVSDAGSGNIDIKFYRDGVLKWTESSKALTSDTITIRSQNSEAGGTMDVEINEFTATANGSDITICG